MPLATPVLDTILRGFPVDVESLNPASGTLTEIGRQRYLQRMPDTRRAVDRRLCTHRDVCDDLHDAGGHAHALAPVPAAGAQGCRELHRTRAQRMLRQHDLLVEIERSTGGTSTWDRDFDDEFSDDLEPDRPHAVSTNGSQFFFSTTNATP
ncbi:hypothetical protein EDB87DRAFT_1691391 [Lactarius vividus]|nr:hypothetical protein EDB87DRAFT_1691391 [Lactarius vividus]